MKRFFTLMALTACCIVCGCDSGEKATPTPGGGGSSTESTTSDPPKAVSNGSLDASEMVKVSLSVPNMTWGGCVVSVRGALEKIETATDIETDRNKQLASFRVSKNVDYKSKLEELAKTTPKLADYSIQ